jgi:hypothetical protein
MLWSNKKRSVVAAPLDMYGDGMYPRVSLVGAFAHHGKALLGTNHSKAEASTKQTHTRSDTVSSLISRQVRMVFSAS